MTDKKNTNVENILKSLREIEEKEKQLKKRKIILQRQKPWFTNPTNIIGLLTIASTIVISLYSLFYNSKEIELTCKYSEPRPLTSFSSRIQENISIKYKDISVNDIGKVTVKIVNSGTAPITKTDLADGPIDFFLKT